MIKFDEMIPGRYYKFGYWYIKVISKSDKTIESYPDVYSNVYIVDCINTENYIVHSNFEMVKNPEWVCIEEIDITELQQVIIDIQFKRKQLQEKEDLFKEILEAINKPK
jgi:hypothetical protein